MKMEIFIALCYVFLSQVVSRVSGCCSEAEARSDYPALYSSFKASIRLTRSHLSSGRGQCNS